MSSSESGSEYLSDASDGEYSDDSSESGDDDSDEALLDMQPMQEQGWHLMSDLFSDTRPDTIPSFSDAHTSLFSHVYLLFVRISVKK